MTFAGLTWDHPRGFNALKAASLLTRDESGTDLIRWEKQPLEGFESHPIADLCDRFDLVVLDHPHLGEAIDADCLLPLDKVFEPDQLDKVSAATIGPCYNSYTMADHQWALPLDAATQVMAARHDLLQAAPPTTWEEVAELSSQSGRVAISLAGPHALLSLLSIANAIDPSLDLRDGDIWLADNVASEAYDILSFLTVRSPAIVYEKNPIDIFQHMSRTDDVLLCPLIYGYVNYSSGAHGQKISFYDSPCINTGGHCGSVLGGTGLALSKRCEPTGALRDHLLWLLDPLTQGQFIPDHDGQPSNRAAWNSNYVNSAWGDFYSSTIRTTEHASVRPRHNGYIAFQSAASAYLRQAITDKIRADDAVREICDMFEASKTTEGRSI